ncbi:MAG: DNA polymerase ligase N-terminal domain-containing protein [Jatrophihabitans sp.]
MASLAEYRRKRDPARTREPMPGGAKAACGDSFVIQEHHASALHWDFRLERDGVLVSWAVPKGVPPDPKVNHLAVHVEDHPLEYASFEGDIAHGEYGGGAVTIWDRGTYETEKWTDREVKVVLRGERVQGRFVLFQTGGKDWIIHRMDGPVRPDWQPLPTGLTPMLATSGPLPGDDGWAFELAWPGLRCLVRVDGGRIAVSDSGTDVTAKFPELRGLGEQLGATQALSDGVVVSLDQAGRPDPEKLQWRIDAGSRATALKRAKVEPVVLMLVDVLHLDGRPLLSVRYSLRRKALVGLELAGAAWQTPPAFDGSGADALAAAQALGVGGVVAKSRSSRYRPGQRSQKWIESPADR